MSKNDIVYFEFNEWSSEYHPNVEPFISWICMSKDKNYYINYIIRKNDLTLKYNYFKKISTSKDKEV